MVGQRGFSLIETMVAVVVVGVLATVVFSAGPAELRYVGAALAETRADRLAAAHIEQLRASGEVPGPGVAGIELAPEHTRGLPRARGRRRVREIEPGLREVTVEIQWWPAGARRPSKVTLQTWMEVPE